MQLLGKRGFIVKKYVMVLILCCLMVFTAITEYTASVSAALQIGTDLNQPILRKIIAAPSQLTAETDGTAVTLT